MSSFPGGHIKFKADGLSEHPGDSLVNSNRKDELREASNEVASVLNSWLNREVKHHLENIDMKLGDLFRMVSRIGVSDGLRARRTSFAVKAATEHEDAYRESPSQYTVGAAQSIRSSDRERPAVTEQLGIGSCISEDLSPDHIPPKRRSARLGATGPLIQSTISKFIKAPLSQMLHVDEKSRAREAKLQIIRDAIQTYQYTRGQRAAAIWRFFEDRYSGPFAQIYATFIPLFVACSVVLSFWQTVDECPLRGSVGEALQSSFESVFALELLSRFLVCPDRCQFWRDPFNFIDLLSALPAFFRIIVAGLSLLGNDIDAQEILSSIAVIPVLRLLKLSRRFEKFQLLLSAFLMAIEALPVLLYSLIVIALSFSALIYFAEPSHNVHSLPHALWFIVVTMTTVGYGDVTPETPMGHVITMFLMVISGLYMAMPIGIVGNAFAQSWGARDRLLLMHRMREAFQQQGFSANALMNIVRLFDGDNDGELGLGEFMEMLDVMQIHMSQDRVELLLENLDTDGSGRISVDELMNGLFPNTYAEMFKSISQATQSSARDTAFLNCDSNAGSLWMAQHSKRSAAQHSKHTSACSDYTPEKGSVSTKGFSSCSFQSFRGLNDSTHTDVGTSSHGTRRVHNCIAEELSHEAASGHCQSVRLKIGEDGSDNNIDAASLHYDDISDSSGYYSPAQPQRATTFKTVL